MNISCDMIYTLSIPVKKNKQKIPKNSKWSCPITRHIELLLLWNERQVCLSYFINAISCLDISMKINNLIHD